MRYSWIVKSVLICFVMFFATTPIYSQNMITIDRDKLQLIINEEVQKGISVAVDQAVAIAVKAEEIKYLDIINKIQLSVNEEVKKGISEAVDGAVSIAVKAEELKYLTILQGKDKLIADKQLEIDILTIQYNAVIIQKQNIQLAYDDYKKSHGLGRDVIIGGVSLSAGLFGGLMLFLYAF